MSLKLTPLVHATQVIHIPPFSAVDQVYVSSVRIAPCNLVHTCSAKESEAGATRPFVGISCIQFSDIVAGWFICQMKCKDKPSVVSSCFEKRKILSKKKDTTAASSAKPNNPPWYGVMSLWAPLVPHRLLLLD
jgi:hypothetical protein